MLLLPSYRRFFSIKAHSRPHPNLSAIVYPLLRPILYLTKPSTSADPFTHPRPLTYLDVWLACVFSATPKRIGLFVPSPLPIQTYPSLPHLIPISELPRCLVRLWFFSDLKVLSNWPQNSHGSGSVCSWVTLTWRKSMLLVLNLLKKWFGKTDFFFNIMGKVHRKE